MHKTDAIRQALREVNPGCGNCIQGFFMDSDSDGDPVISIVFVLEDPPAGKGWDMDRLDDLCCKANSAIESLIPYYGDCWFRTQSEYEAELKDMITSLDEEKVADCGGAT